MEITPKTLDAHVGEKIKFSASAKDAAGNPIDEKPSVWFAAPFDLAGADESGEVTFHAPGMVTVGAVIAGKAGYATVNVADSKVASVEIEPPAYPTSLSAARKSLLPSRAQPTAIPEPMRRSIGLRRSRRSPAWTRPGWSPGLHRAASPIKATSEGASGTVTLQVVRDAVRKLTVTARVRGGTHRRCRPLQRRGDRWQRRPHEGSAGALVFRAAAAAGHGLSRRRVCGGEGWHLRGHGQQRPAQRRRVGRGSPAQRGARG